MGGSSLTKQMRARAESYLVKGRAWGLIESGQIIELSSIKDLKVPSHSHPVLLFLVFGFERKKIRRATRRSKREGFNKQQKVEGPGICRKD